MAKPRIIELLAPAKDAETAIQAILHGADAVYMGAPSFGARAAAGNDLESIARVVEVAHGFHVRVYVTLNVLLHDHELAQVESLIHALWELGVDALIVQDMGVTQLNIPPIPLHASTQSNNQSPEKVAFLEQVGFRQVVLARELSLDQIREIAAATTVKLECFVHGALCVSYSGQCTISHALSGRSANRGQCAQWCRMPYDVYDANGNLLAARKHVLSLRDLNQTEQLEALIDAGVTSFKIEGRLKDVSYVKNITAWYHLRLNDIIEQRKDLVRPSIGVVNLDFEPNPVKSFNRGFTTYFLQGRAPMNNPMTPKSMGEPVGVVSRVTPAGIEVRGNSLYANGDGLSFVNGKGQFDGFRVNKVVGNTLIPASKPAVKVGTPLYRTFDQAFERQTDKSSTRRIIPVEVDCWDTREGLAVEMADAYGHRFVKLLILDKVKAKSLQRDAVVNVLSKTGQTHFEVTRCRIDWSSEWFLPASVWTSLRRELCDGLDRVIRMAYKRERVRLVPTHHPYPEKELDSLGQVLNEAAKSFFLNHGVQRVAWAAEHVASTQYDQPTRVMINKYCLKYEWGLCPNVHTKHRATLAVGGEPAYLLSQQTKLYLHFDCNRCEMSVLLKPKLPQG